MVKSVAYRIREATSEDVPSLFQMVRKLAEYEKLLPEVTASEELYQNNGFGNQPFFTALLAEHTGDNSPRFLGFALYFFTFSTFTGRPTLYLEDLFVLPEFRGRGIGKALLRALAQVALNRSCGRMEWSVLNWNDSAIRLYRALGARPMKDWTVYRLLPAEIEALANG